MNRNVWAAIAATVAVLGVVILGFLALGGPGTQRMVQSDLRTVKMLAQLAQQVHDNWDSSGRVLPSSLEKIPNSVKQDPVTHKTFVYKPKPENKYELCATFANDNQDLQNTDPNAPWTHPKGDYCFEFDASQQVPAVPYYY